MKEVFNGESNEEYIYTLLYILKNEFAFDQYSDKAKIKEMIDNFPEDKILLNKKHEYLISNKLMEMYTNDRQRKQAYHIAKKISDKYFGPLHEAFQRGNDNLALLIYMQMTDNLIDILHINQVHLEEDFPFYDIDSIDFNECIFEYYDYVEAIPKVDNFLKENTPDYVYSGYYSVVAHQIYELYNKQDEEVKKRYLDIIIKSYLTPLVIDVKNDELPWAATKYFMLLSKSVNIIYSLEAENVRKLR